MAKCGFQPADLNYAPCTREAGHDGPCAHPLAQRLHPQQSEIELAEARRKIEELESQLAESKLAVQATIDWAKSAYGWEGFWADMGWAPKSQLEENGKKLRDFIARLTKFAAVFLLIAALVVTANAATIYGIRYKPLPDGTTERFRWLTSATSVELEVPGHGTVLVFVEGEELLIHANGDKDGGRDLTVRGLVVNQLRVGLSR